MDEKNTKKHSKHNFNNFFLDGYTYDDWFDKPNHKEGDKEEAKEEVKNETGTKILTPNKVLTKLPVLLAQIKAENNSYKLKNEVKQKLYLLY